MFESDKWVFKTRQGLRFPIYEGFTATIQYDYDYDNDPSSDADEKWDSKLMFFTGVGSLEINGEKFNYNWMMENRLAESLINKIL